THILLNLPSLPFCMILIPPTSGFLEPLCRTSFRSDYLLQLLAVFPREESQRDQDCGVSEFVFNDVLGLLFPCLLSTNIQDVVHYLECESCLPPVSAESIYDAGFCVRGVSAYLP